MGSSGGGAAWAAAGGDSGLPGGPQSGYLREGRPCLGRGSAAEACPARSPRVRRQLGEGGGGLAGRPGSAGPLAQSGAGFFFKKKIAETKKF